MIPKGDPNGECRLKKYIAQRAPSLVLALLVALGVFVTGAAAQSTTERPANEPAQSPKVELQSDLPGDQEVQSAVKQHQQPTVAKTETETPVDPTLFLSNRLQDIRQHLASLAVALPKLPSEIGRIIRNVESVTQGYGFLSIIVIAAIFMFVGFCAVWLFYKVTSRTLIRLEKLIITGPGDRLRFLGSRLLLIAGSIVTFIVSSILIFLYFELPGIVQNIILQLLLAALVSWVGWSLLNLLLTPSMNSGSGERAGWRVIPMSDDGARHFTRMLSLAVIYFAFGSVIVRVSTLLGMDFGVNRLLAYGLALGLLFIGLYTIARQPEEPLINKHAPAERSKHGSSQKWLYSSGFIALWVLWAITAKLLFWLLAVCLALPIGIRCARLAVYELFKQEKLKESDDIVDQAPTPSVWAAVAERGLRAILIFSAVVALTWAWGFEIGDLTDRRDLASRLTGAGIEILTIFLIGDLLWQIIKTAIDTTLQGLPDSEESGEVETVRQAKLRTLLPIIRATAMVLLLTLTIMMTLSQLGVEIGPLIASAGVVGIAVGFGAQTLVKDIFSGMFYLLDDAFRIGEYIIAGKYKGTVESFSLRSVRLRHHRGPIYTIPFGDLGAVQNLSRDFVIDKLSFNVSYDTDLEKARKLIKQIGLELAEDPELGPKILGPLKMQRVENFGDYGIEIKTKMTCVPGGQWEVRQKIYPLIKQRFEENGIEFARPSVRVSDKGSDNAAAAGAVVSAHAKKAAPTQA